MSKVVYKRLDHIRGRLLFSDSADSSRKQRQDRIWRQGNGGKKVHVSGGRDLGRSHFRSCFCCSSMHMVSRSESSLACLQIAYLFDPQSGLKAPRESLDAASFDPTFTQYVTVPRHHVQRSSRRRRKGAQRRPTTPRRWEIRSRTTPSHEIEIHVPHASSRRAISRNLTERSFWRGRIKFFTSQSNGRRSSSERSGDASEAWSSFVE